ncbi:hypothetical protein KFE25_010989 [Diacronema lutheri]|uniref:Uncharacterized protein n=3 Tax=Diacronema lutheri TaxID=2081491 RepID=A0A8J5XJT3_DIALT|nr:hypothetical protein KFE25_010989 [Diacronema lutheri]
MARVARTPSLSSTLLVAGAPEDEPCGSRSSCGSSVDSVADSGSDADMRSTSIVGMGSDGLLGGALFRSEDFASTLDLNAILADGQTADEAAATPHDRLVAIKLGAASFGYHFAVLLIKITPFAATYAGQRVCGLPLKSVLALAQTCGYLTGKPLALLIVPKLRRERLLHGLLLVLWGQGLALVLATRHGAIALAGALYVGGVFGAAAWGLIVRLCEGRARTDAIMSCVSFCAMGMGGVAKSAASALLGAGLPNGGMMCACATAGLVLGSATAALLAAQEPPSMADVALRGERRELSSVREQGVRLIRRHGLGVALATCAYVLVGTLRAYRDFYQPELFEAVGLGGRPALFAASELSVAACVLTFTAALSIITDSWVALNVILAAAMSGGLALALATFLFRAHAYSSGFAWMLLVGAGAFFAYVPVGTVLYERLLAAAHEQLTTSMLSILSDAAVLVGTGLLLAADSMAAARAGRAPHSAHGATTATIATPPAAVEAGAVFELFSRIAVVGGVLVGALLFCAALAFNASVRKTREASSMLGLPVSDFAARAQLHVRAPAGIGAPLMAQAGAPSEAAVHAERVDVGERLAPNRARAPPVP